MFSLTIKSRQFGFLGRVQAKFTYFYTLTYNSITLQSVSLAIWLSARIQTKWLRVPFPLQSLNYQQQPSRGALQLYWNHTLAWVLSCKFLYISRTAFPKSTSWGLLLNFHSLCDCAQIKSKVDLKSHFHLPKNCFICFSKSPLKMMKNTFYFILQTLFVLKIFKFLSYFLVM